MNPPRIFLAVALILLPLGFGTASAAASCQKVNVGAVRWDGWHGDDTDIGKAVENSLGQEKWRSRWPIFETNEADGIEFDGSRNEVVEEEMRLAAAAGIDYWAFVYYNAGSAMRRVFETYLKSSKPGPKFALIVQIGRITGANAEQNIREIHGLFKSPRYFTDPQGRPLVFVMMSPKKKDSPGVFDAIKKVQAVPETNRGVSPSVVVMSFSADAAATMAKRIGSERISTYAAHGQLVNGTYAQLAGGAQSTWKRQADTGAAALPIVMSGWDPRPRFLNPERWGKTYPHREYYQAATPAEFGEHLRRGLEWAQRDARGGCAVLIYAWNEFDEGGWIAPTKGEGDTRLKVVKETVESTRSSKSKR